MEKRTCGIILLLPLLVAFGMLLTAVAAQYWVDDANMNAGVWHSCTKVPKLCQNNVQAMELVGKADTARAVQALVCLAVVLGLVAVVANIIWIIRPDTQKIRVLTCAAIIFTGLFMGIGVGVFGMLYSETASALSLLTGGGASNMPSGWTYYIAIGATTIFEVLGMAACCCACQNDSGQVGSRGYGGHNTRAGYPGRHNRGYGPRHSPSYHHGDIPMHSKAWNTGNHGPQYPTGPGYGSQYPGGPGYGPQYPGYGSSNGSQLPSAPNPLDLYPAPNNFHPGGPVNPAYPPGYSPNQPPPAYHR